MKLKFHGLKVLRPKKMVEELPFIEEKHDVCECCALEKQHRQPLNKGVAWRANHVLQLVYVMCVDSWKLLLLIIGISFFFSDNYKYDLDLFHEEKSEVFSIFKVFKSLVKKQNGLIKVFRSDIGKE